MSKVPFLTVGVLQADYVSGKVGNFNSLTVNGSSITAPTVSAVGGGFSLLQGGVTSVVGNYGIRTLAEGSNITITPVGETLQISAVSGAGGIALLTSTPGGQSLVFSGAGGVLRGLVGTGGVALSLDGDGNVVINASAATGVASLSSTTGANSLVFNSTGVIRGIGLAGGLTSSIDGSGNLVISAASVSGSGLASISNGGPNTSLVLNGATGTLKSVSAVNGIAFTPTSDNVAVGLLASGVTPVGSAALIRNVSIDTYGRITSAAAATVDTVNAPIFDAATGVFKSLTGAGGITVTNNASNLVINAPISTTTRIAKQFNCNGTYNSPSVSYLGNGTVSTGISSNLEAVGFSGTIVRATVSSNTVITYVGAWRQFTLMNGTSVLTNITSLTDADTLGVKTVTMNHTFSIGAFLQVRVEFSDFSGSAYSVSCTLVIDVTW